MRAYNISMVTIFINAGFYIVGLMNVFGDLGSNAWLGIFGTFATPLVTVAGVSIRGIDAIAVAIAVSTIIILNTNAINDRGVAYTVFTIVFWGSFGIASVTLGNIALPGVEVFYGIYFLACTLIFIMALVQMPTGGQKAHV